MIQIRPRIEITEETMKKIENTAKGRNQKIHQYIEDLLNGRVTEKEYSKCEGERLYECHVFLPESLHTKIVEGAKENAMTQKDYIVRLLESKGKPLRVTYNNNDIVTLIKTIEDIKEYLSIIAQGVEETNEIGENQINNAISKTNEVLEIMLCNTSIERKNRKQLIKEAKLLIKKGYMG